MSRKQSPIGVSVPARTACPSLIDPTVEKLYTIRAACLLPEMNRNGKPIDYATGFRWVTRGVRGIVLETIMQGGAKVTSREAIARFFARLSGEIEVTETRTNLQRQRASERAGKELAAAGW